MYEVYLAVTVNSPSIPEIIILFGYIKDPVRTSEETHYVSAAKPNRLMLFRETVDVYCENHTEHN
jgi:hypothetical protein